MSTPETTTQIDERIADRFQLKALVEACLVLDEGIAGVRDIDLGMMMGTGMIPGPFARADFRGLDDILAALEQAEEEWGEGFEPPLILRRLVAQGRLGAKSGQGFYPYPQPDEGWEQSPVKLDTRDDVAILWLDNPPANSLAPQVVEALEKAWKSIEGGGVKALIIASPNPALFCAGADIKAFTQMDEAAGKDLLDRAHALFRAWEQSRIMTIAAVNGLALGGGCEIAMACDVRLAAYSASFGQPEINLGIIPGFGGTQRLPRLVGPAKALEMNTVGEPISAEEAYEFGLVNRLVADHELFDTALAWARKFAGQAPVALEPDQARLARGRSRRGDRGREGRLRDRVRLRGRARGHRRVPAEAQAGVQGPVSGPSKLGRASSLREHRGDHDRLAELIRSARSVVALTRGGHSPSRPASPTSARPAPGCGRTSTRWRSPTSRSGAATRSASGASTGTASPRSRARSPTARTARWRSWASRSSRRTSTACTLSLGLRM